MKSGIYRITNKVNGKHYVGQSWGIATRWSEHRSHAKNVKSDRLICRAINKYGLEAFDFAIVVEVANQEDLDRYEDQIIDMLGALWPNGYNMRRGGLGGRLVKARAPISEETRKRMSIAHTGRVFSAESRKRISESNTGHTHSEVTRAKMKMKASRANLVYTDERRQKMSDTWVRKTNGARSPRPCEHCSTVFKPARQGRRFCSKFCSARNRVARQKSMSL